MPLNEPVVALAAFFAIFVVAIAVTVGCLKRLRSAHPVEWERLGRPSLSSIGPLPGKFNLFKYNWSGTYRRLGDPSLARSFSLLKVCDVAGGGALAWYAVSFFSS